jgi:salicylate hydroxylase
VSYDFKPLTKSELTTGSYDMYKDIEEKLASTQGQAYSGQFICGLPIGLELPSGITIGAR